MHRILSGSNIFDNLHLVTFNRLLRFSFKLHMMSSLIIVIIILIVIYNIKQIWDFIKFRVMIGKLPGLPQLAFPLIGQSYLMAGSSHDLFQGMLRFTKQHCQRSKSKIFKMWLGPYPLVFLAHPDAVEVILKNSKHTEKGFTYKFMHPWLGSGLLTSHGEKWKQRRRLITSSFHFDILQEFAKIMNAQSKICVEKLRNQLRQNDKIDIRKPMAMCTLDIICATAMGESANVQQQENSEFVTAIKRCDTRVCVCAFLDKQPKTNKIKSSLQFFAKTKASTRLTNFKKYHALECNMTS